jgi:2'-5' RNA ligase
VVVGRLFIAVTLPEEARHAVATLLDGHGKPLPGRVVHPRNWHLTLRFLGDTDDVAYERLLAALDQAPLGEPFRVALGRPGAFPQPARATVLWVGFAKGGAELQRLADAVEAAVELAGFPPEDRPFRPHLTLSRIRPHQDVRPVIDRLSFDGISWTVGEVAIIRSHLGPGGPRYEQLEQTILGGEHTFD